MLHMNGLVEHTNRSQFALHRLWNSPEVILVPSGYVSSKFRDELGASSRFNAAISKMTFQKRKRTARIGGHVVSDRNGLRSTTTDVT